MEINLIQSLIIITLYLLLCAVFAIVAKFNIKKYHKIRTSTIFVFSLLFTALNVLCTIFSKDLNGTYISDRQNYFVEFNGIRNTSTGLSAIFQLAHWLGTGFDSVLYITTFLTFFLTLYSMRNTKTIAPVIFILCTDFIFISFHRLKQSLACAFGSVYLMNVLENGLKKKRIANILLLVASILLHPASFILIFATIITMARPKARKNIFIEILLISTTLFFLTEIIEFIATNTASIIPSLSQRIHSYLLEESTTLSTSFIRGIPIYCIVIFGAINTLNNKNPKSDEALAYFTLSIFTSIIYIVSVKSYWIYRLADYFIVPIAMYFGYLYRQSEGNDKKNSPLLLILILQSFMTIRWIILMYINYNGF